MNRNFNYIIRLFILFALLTSCQKVVNIDLNSSNPNLVVEAYLSDQPVDTVFLSKTVNFDESNIFPPVTGASVKISDDRGNSYTLHENLPGTYVMPGLEGNPGSIYSLEIIADGITYSSSSKMPAPVKIDSLYLEKGYFGDNSLKIQFRDSAGINNYYRFVQVINGIPDKSIHIANDMLEDGEEIIYSLHENEDEALPGDTITVFLQCIDKPVYEYFRTLLMGRRGGQSTAPANPLSNINNKALGYFSAYSVRSKTIIIP